MKKYSNQNHNSGVESYEIGDDYIVIKFYDSEFKYKYTYDVPGIDDVEKMKELANAGKGLNTYINQNVRDAYESKYL